MIDWYTILNREELAAYWRNVAKLDSNFARISRMWWENATINKLHSVKAGAWLANDREGYFLASSYLALHS